MADLTEENLRGLTYDYVEKDFFTFEGEDYRTKQGTSGDPDKQWIELPKRERRVIHDDLNQHLRSSKSGRESPPWQPRPPKKFEKKPFVRNILFV